MSKQFFIHKSALFALLTLALSMGMTACYEKLTEPIPYKFVDFTIDLNAAGNGKLTGIGGYYVEPSEGVKGIIIFHRGNEDFVAYDRCCSYKPADPCGIVNVDANLLTATDSCCKSKFLLSDGSPAEGPAIKVLKQYFVQQNGSLLRITN